MDTILAFLDTHHLNWLDIGGTFVGLFYIYYQFRISYKLWIASFVMSLFYIALNVQGGLYALAGIYVYYCLAALYGLYCWLAPRLSKASGGVAKVSEETASDDKPAGHIPLRLYPYIIGAILVLTLFLAGVLTLLHEDATLWADAFTSATSIVAMWLLAKKYCEHWIFWLFVDGINCGLYTYLGSQYLFSALLFGFYALTCVFGYSYWLKKLNNISFERNDLLE